MELWIRSQDKKRLYKATELFIEKDVYKDWCIETEIGHDYITKNVWYICVNQARLGKYFSEERALEILDEIEKLLNPIIIYKNIDETENIKILNELFKCNGKYVSTQNNSDIHYTNSSIVYQMPKE